MNTKEEEENMTKDRSIGVAVDFSKGSKLALKWAIDNLFEKGDTLYVIHIKAPLGRESRNQLWSTSGSRKVLCFTSLFFFLFLLDDGSDLFDMDLVSLDMQL